MSRGIAEHFALHFAERFVVDFAALFERIKSRRNPDSQSGMLALRAFSVGHFAAKLAWSFPTSLSIGNPFCHRKSSCTADFGMWIFFRNPVVRLGGRISVVHHKFI